MNTSMPMLAVGLWGALCGLAGPSGGAGDQALADQVEQLDAAHRVLLASLLRLDEGRGSDEGRRSDEGRGPDEGRAAARPRPAA